MSAESKAIELIKIHGKKKALKFLNNAMKHQRKIKKYWERVKNIVEKEPT